MSSKSTSAYTKPRIIIHGGAGNISHSTLPPDRQIAYKSSMLRIISSARSLLKEGHTALDVATHAVTLFENDPLFNCGRGAVFTRSGTIELEASIMVSRGYRKRGVGCMLLKHIKHPIQLAREMLIRGEEEDGKGGGAYAHSQLSGKELERLAGEWGLELVDPKWFWTRRRWEEHLKGLERENKNLADIEEKTPDITEPHFDGDDPSWDGHEYLPQGTVGAVVLDHYGTLCVATSTGGLTNKLPGRIGDTPTLGAGFWAEEWEDQDIEPANTMQYAPTGTPSEIEMPWAVPSFSQHLESAKQEYTDKIHAVAMSGTGNGDSFLRVAAARTAAAMTRFSQLKLPLATAVTQVAGPCGELQRSAGDRWGRTGEGEGGLIGIELMHGKGRVVWDFNCGGMFRAWLDEEDKAQWLVFRES
ncbi:N-terminal nucleophile aminohydrolase [Rhizodiscina lignyota]|uniref:N-terminal nucleophile aminohydrolase n=1 Tax=Rhizodiscina lignyota TaxID=1504668 RepID=A0A9P4IF38_9PEZI|nr:N-terminal nucleophile aminohydrolase [Rhizodiscina lignyota]